MTNCHNAFLWCVWHEVCIVINVDLKNNVINIDFEKQPVQCNVSVSSAKNPILYSNNQYISEKSGDAIFLIPYYPPKELTFEYGTKNEESDITITAIFEKSDYNYVMQTKKIHIGTTDE